MRRSWLSTLLIVLFGIAAALIVLELGVRAWFGLRGTEQDRVRYLDDRAAIAARTAQLIGVPYLNYVLNPAQPDVNERGLRGERVAIPKPDDVFRIVALGGSTTYGHGLSADEAWPAQLQRILRETYGQSGVEVVNLGTPGYHSLDSLVNLATRGLAHEPDLIISYDGLNDAVVRMFQSPACYSGDTPLLGMGMDRGLWQPGGEPLPPSALYRVLAIPLGWMDDPAVFTARFDPTGLCPPEPGDISPLELLQQNPPVYFERNLRGMVALARASGARVALSTFAWDVAAAEAQLAANAELFQAQAMIDAIDEQNALVRQLAGELELPLFDLAADIRSGPYYQGDQVHMNAEGARRQAELYAEALDRAGLIAEGQ